VGTPALLPIRGKVCCGFISPLKVHHLAGFEPPTLGSSNKHTNQYAIEATKSSPRKKLQEYYSNTQIKIMKRASDIVLQLKRATFNTLDAYINIFIIL
jgi:hypothetical protein